MLSWLSLQFSGHYITTKYIYYATKNHAWVMSEVAATKHSASTLLFVLTLCLDKAVFVLTNSILTYSALWQKLSCCRTLSWALYVHLGQIVVHNVHIHVLRLLMAAKLVHTHVYDNLHRQASTLQIERFPYANTTCTCTRTMYADLHTTGARTNNWLTSLLTRCMHGARTGHNPPY